MKTGLTRTLVVLLFVASALIISAAPLLSAQGYVHQIPGEDYESAPPSDDSGQEFVPGEILVKFKTTASQSRACSVMRQSGLTVIQSLPAVSAVRASVPKGSELAKCAKLAANSAIEFAEPNYIAYPTDITPSDSYFASSQWGLAKIQAPAAWEVTRGSESVIVAVLDTGVDYTHPDLAARMVAGRDTYSNDANPMDEYGHGTKTAGVIGACTDNALGVAGITWNCRIMPIKVSASNGYSPYSCIASGITYAVDHGAKVVNISISGASASSTLQNAVNYAYQRGCLVVASSGNDSKAVVNYPAACTNVIAVGATTSSDTREGYSNYGSALAIVAPGNAFTTIKGGGYGSFNGTSAASPHVAAVAALIFSVKPSLTVADVAKILKNTADDVDAAGIDTYTGYGRVNAYEAVLAAGGGGTVPIVPTPDTIAPTVAVTSPSSGSTVSGTVSLTATASDNVGVASLKFYVDGVLKGSTSSGSLAWNSAAETNGVHTITAVASDAAGNTRTSAAVTATVSNSTSTNQVFTGQLTKGMSKTHTMSVASTSAVTANLAWTGAGTLQLLVRTSSGTQLINVSSAISAIQLSPGTFPKGVYRIEVYAVAGLKMKYSLTMTLKPL